MKPLWTIPLLFTLIFALGCGGDDAEGGDDNGSADQQNDPGQGNPYGGGGQGGGPPGGQAGGPPGGQGGGPPGGEGGFGGGDPSGAGNPYGGGQGGGFGGAPQPQQPTFDPSLPAGKKQVWTKAKITTAWKGKSAAELIKSFGNPANHKQQGNLIVYFYDNMYVKEKNMKYSKVSFAIQPDGKGGGSVFAIGLVPNSATRIQPAGGQGGFPGQGGGFPGQGGGFPGGAPGDGEDTGGGGPPGGGQGGAPPGGKRPR